MYKGDKLMLLYRKLIIQVSSTTAHHDAKMNPRVETNTLHQSILLLLKNAYVEIVVHVNF